jgi:hypothetical protein
MHPETEFSQLPSDIEALADVKSRNNFRRQFGLSPIELQKELDRIHQARERRTFKRWLQSPLRYRVEQKLLRRVRRRLNNPNWEPTGILSGGGWAFHIELLKQMRKLRERLDRSFRL